MMRAGGRSRLSCAHPKGFLHSMSTRKPVTTPPAIKSAQYLFLVAASTLVVCGLALNGVPAAAQIPQVTTSQPLPPGQDPNAGKQDNKIRVDVNLVVLHTTVLDDRGRFADGLKQDNFRVLEDKVEQKLSIFKREDIPVSMGLVIDNSGSMRDKRPRVN